MIEERHYRAQEVAKLWGISYQTILRMFQDEPGVLKLGSYNTKRRTRVSIRIPESVMKRVYAEKTK
jgi:hypothetical protein